jgi:hypothetical protein
MFLIGVYESRTAHSHKRLEELSRWVELGWLGFLLWGFMFLIGVYESRTAHSHKRLEELSRWVELGWLGFLLWGFNLELGMLKEWFCDWMRGRCWLERVRGGFDGGVGEGFWDKIEG